MLNQVLAFHKEEAAPVINKYRGRRRLSVRIAAEVSQAEHRRLATRGLRLLRRRPAASTLQNNLLSFARLHLPIVRCLVLNVRARTAAASASPLRNGSLGWQFGKMSLIRKMLIWFSSFRVFGALWVCELAWWP
jgi:hypothetical protein